MDDSLPSSQGSGQDDVFDGGPVGALTSTGHTPWPLFDAPTSYRSAHAPYNVEGVNRSKDTTATVASQRSSHDVEEHPVPTRRRPSVLRLFTGLSRLRRTDTGETSGSSGNTSDLTSPVSLEAHEETEDAGEVLQEPGDDAVEAYIRKHARK
jgi:hypothetical protein